MKTRENEHLKYELLFLLLNKNTYFCWKKEQNKMKMLQFGKLKCYVLVLFMFLFEIYKFRIVEFVMWFVCWDYWNFESLEFWKCHVSVFVVFELLILLFFWMFDWCWKSEKMRWCCCVCCLFVLFKECNLKCWRKHENLKKLLCVFVVVFEIVVLWKNIWNDYNLNL